MKPRLEHLGPIILLATVLGVAIWAAGTVSRTETGWAALATQWRDASVGWLLGKRVAVHDLEPTDQADVWLAQIERIGGVDMLDARLATGAALVLDLPATGFTSRYTRSEDLSGLVIFPRTDYDAVGLAVDEFEAKTRQPCLAMAARATQLAPEDRDAWRLRALLQFGPSLYRGNPEPRTADWEEVLRQCARHDPDNALYDYLAAFQHWNAGGSWDWDEDDLDKYEVTISDPERFALGTACLERGLRKRYLRAGESALPAVIEVLARSSIPSTEHPMVVGSCDITGQVQSLLICIGRWLRAQASTRLDKNDAKGVWDLSHQALRLADQCANDREALARYGLFVRPFAAGALLRMRKVAEQHPDEPFAAELAAVRGRYEATLVDLKIAQEAAQSIGAQQRAQNRSLLIVLAAIWAVTPPCVVLLVFVAVLAWGAARVLAKGGPSERAFGWHRHVLAWLLGCGLTFAVLGMAPAEIIARKVQAWIALGLIGIGVLSGMAWVAWMLLGRRGPQRLQFSLRSMLVLTAVFALLCGLVKLWNPGIDGATYYASALTVPARGWERFDAEVLRKVIMTGASRWAWAVWQWTAYRGLLVGAGISLILVALWRAARAARQPAEPTDGEGRSLRRARWGTVLRCVVRSAFGLAALLFLVHLALTPPVVDSLERQHQQQMSYFRDPAAYWSRLEAEIAAVKADVARMQLIRARVVDELAAADE